MKKRTYKTLEEFDEILGFTPEQIAEIKRDSEYFCLLMDLRALRKKLGYTQEELSKKAGIPRPTLSLIENGERNATIKTLSTIAEAMGKKLEIKFR